MHTIYATDSMGHGLCKFMKENDQRVHVENHFVVKSGTTIGYLRFHVNRLVKDITGFSLPESITIVLAACINNLTSKIKNNTSFEIIYDITSERKEHLQIELIDFFQQFYEQKINVKIATIPPANLDKYNKFKYRYNKNYEQQQKNLETDVKEINHFIVDLNTSCNNSTINLAKDLFKYGKRRSGRKGRKTKLYARFCYANLYDGLHASFHLKMKWFQVLLSSSINDILPNYFDQDSLSEEDSTWDFKRGRGKETGLAST